MKTKKTANGSSRNKSKLFDSLLGNNDLEIDPCYKLFLEHLSKDESTYVLDLPDGDHGMPVSVRYGEDDSSYGNAKDKDGPNSPNGSRCRSRGVPHGTRRGAASGKTRNVNVGQSFSPRTLSVEKKTSGIDPDYELFLNLVKFKDGFMVIEPEPGVTIVYEQEENMPAGYDELRAGSSTKESEPLMSPLENMEEDNAMRTFENGIAQAYNIAPEHEMAGPSSKDLDGQDIICTDERGLVLYTEPSALDAQACEDEQGTPLALSSFCSSTFDEKLNAVLSQPYDQNEYEELWRKATDRKPVSRQRHLRSATKRYATEAIGLSYLDYYPPDEAIQSSPHHCDWSPRASFLGATGPAFQSISGHSVPLFVRVARILFLQVEFLKRKG
ncbi:hypothetical protein ACP70R_040212 [Stipagrostis hirtigluma subsp. patula]